jgi:thiamine kinase-like enzyme
MEKFTPQQVKEKILAIENLSLKESDVTEIREQQGGLVNYVFRIETTRGLFFLKQFLGELKADFFKGLELGPKDRITLSYEVENTFEEILGKETKIIPHIFEHNKEEGYLAIEGFNIVKPLIEEFKLGNFPEAVIKDLANKLARVHQITYKNPNTKLNLYNKEWLKLKLKYQYYEVASFLSQKNAQKLINFANGYIKRKFVLTHGDLCSINILLDDKAWHLIDFEDAHIGTPAFDLGYFLSELFIARLNFPEKKEQISFLILEFLNNYFKIFDKQERAEVEKEASLHLGSLLLYRTFGLSKDIFTSHVREEVRSQIKELAESIFEKENLTLSNLI